MKRWYWLLVLMMSVLLSVALIGCPTDEDEDDDEDDGGDDWTPPPADDDDDDTTDDDDDDTTDDDDDTTDDDDDSVGSDPEISNASWAPDPAEYDAVEDHWISVTTFYVCDVDDDLSGGNIYFLQAGTNDSAWTVPFFSWDDYIAGGTLGDVTDCAAPAEAGIGTIFGEGPTAPGPGTTCIDIEVSDGQANFSNKLTNLCVDVPGPK